MLRARSRKPRLWIVAPAAVCLVGFWRLVSLFSPGTSSASATVTIDGAALPEFLSDSLKQPQDTLEHNHFSSRQLLFTLPNCTPPAIEQFPNDLFTPQQRREGAVAFHLLVSIYMFLGLAIVCDDYFVPSLESICEVLKLQTDVAGATFMAAGSSAPELATAIIGVFVAKDDIGLGAVVGSAVFNIMFVISVCALFAGMVVYLNWWPLFRDCAFYTLSIVALVLVIYDEAVYWYEALGLLCLYALYIIIMFFNPRLEQWMNSRSTCCKQDRPVEEEKGIMIDVLNQNGKVASNYDVMEAESSEDGSSVTDAIETNSLLPQSGSVAPDDMELRPPLDPYECNVKPDEEDSVLTFPQGWWRRSLWIISLPFVLLLYITIPDCRRERWKKWFFVTFIMSVVWISLFSYLAVWMITVVGHTWHIPDTIMGLTFIAAGVSIPDAIASLLVVREGLGDMAISNAVGSNVFDILLCLGLPWFIKTVMQSPGSYVEVYSAGLTYSALTLLSTVVLLLLATHLNGWKMDKKYGVFLMVIYALFMVLAVLYEMNIFGYFHPPECQSSYR